MTKKEAIHKVYATLDCCTACGPPCRKLRVSMDWACVTCEKCLALQWPARDDKELGKKYELKF